MGKYYIKYEYYKLESTGALTRKEEQMRMLEKDRILSNEDIVM